MFGFLKNLLRHPPAQPVETQEPSYEETASAPWPPSPPSLPPAQRFAPPPRKNAVAQAQKPAAPQAQHNKGVEVSLQKILANLPLELQPRVLVPDVGELAISVPLEKILAQLSTGAVKISFGELRRAAPGVFSQEPDRDRALVSLPLSDVLARLNPALITRRRVQRQVEVPEEITSPFDQYGQGLEFSVQSPRGEVPKAPAPSAPTPPRQTFAPPPSQVPPVRRTFTPVPSPVPPPVMPPAAPAPQEIVPAEEFSAEPEAPPVSPETFSFIPQARPTFTPPAPAAPQPVIHKAPVPAPAPAQVPTAASNAPRMARESNGTNHTPAAHGNETAPLLLTLTSLAESWPEALRKQIVEFNLVEAKVALPVNAVEQALKLGRIAFSWKTLRSWIKPPIPQNESVHDSVVLELPLKIVAPLFLSRQQEANQSKQKVLIDEDIPNLFFGFPQPEPANNTVTGAGARTTDTNYYVWDDAADSIREDASAVPAARPTPGTKFVAKYATPNEVVSRAASLDGVAGALIALPDGLMVASRLSPDLNADTLAAFLPQIFAKVSQCTKELRMGDLNNLNFTVGNVPWKIFRVNAIFFAAFGRAGEALPTAQLAALAAELDHKPK
jgi:predicted regulator of Ras-like GTPase activity (Roadblock/LC7/MglB family)